MGAPPRLGPQAGLGPWAGLAGPGMAWTWLAPSAAVGLERSAPPLLVGS